MDDTDAMLLSNARAEADELRAEVERLKAELAGVLEDSGVTCVFCGAYHARPCTLEDIRAHVEVCPKHPLPATRADNERLRAALGQIQGLTGADAWGDEIDRIARAALEAKPQKERTERLSHGEFTSIRHRAEQAECEAAAARSDLKALLADVGEVTARLEARADRLALADALREAAQFQDPLCWCASGYCHQGVSHERCSKFRALLDLAPLLEAVGDAAEKLARWRVKK